MNKNRYLKNTSIGLLLIMLSTLANAESGKELAVNNVNQTASIGTQFQTIYEKDAQRVLAFVEQSQDLRKQLPLFFSESKQAIKAHNGALPASYSMRLANALQQANEMRDGLFDQALRHRSALYRADMRLSDAERTAEIIIGMAAAVTLYDNHQITNDALTDNALLRDKLNEAYPELGIEGGYLSASNIRALNPEYRKAMNDAVRYFYDNKSAIAQQINISSPTIQHLYQTVAQSPMIKKVHGSSVFKQIIILPIKVVKGTAEGVIGLSDLGLKRIKFNGSKVAGNAMGMVRWRDGKLKNDAAILLALQAQLQPGDILLEKTPFTLTDKSIPGHFGHAALYTGTAAQLKVLGAQNLPHIQQQLDNIASGHVVVEALRNGVQLNSLQQFMNIDDVAILRPKYLNPQAKIDAVNIALGNLGKQYDFNFDVNTTEKIVCSELIYIVYPQIDFVTKRVLGSFAITPDDVAIQAGSVQDPLAVVLFVHDGKLILDATHDENGLVLYNQLVKGEAENFAGKTQNAQFKGFIR